MNQTQILIGLFICHFLADYTHLSTTWMLNANPSDPTIRNSFLVWNKGGGRVLDGLTKRRTKEANLYFA